jgi:uncharacterized ParB-like nuclease family protein
MKIALSNLVAEGTTQARQYSESLADRYAEAMKLGAVFPPVVVFKNGSSYYLGDGFHRLGAVRKLGQDSIEVEVKDAINGEPAQRSAILYAVGANEQHGLNRSNDDKRHAVEMLLRDPEWSKWTDREIARQCRVSNTFVSSQRSKLINRGSTTRKRKDKHGNVSTIETKNIGKKKPLTDEQKKVAKQVRDSTKPKESKAPEWTAADEHGYSMLRSAWNKASAAARAKFIGEVA